MTAETDKDKTASGEVEDKAHAISLDDLEPLVPPDGGWAWMILVGSFVAFFFVNAISFSYGVILSDLQTEFECSTTIISLGGSLIVGCTLISGKAFYFVCMLIQPHLLIVNSVARSHCKCDGKQIQLPNISHWWIICL